MTLKNTVGTLAQGAVSTAVSAVRHPISTASMAAGLVKGTAEASVDLVRVVVRGQGEAEVPVSDPVAAPVVDQVEEQVDDLVDDEVADRVEEQVDVPTQRQETIAEVSTPAATEAEDVPREPEVVPKPVPAIDELPEPVVIEADDAPGEAIHTEPKAASRDSEHGGLPGDREEAEGYVEEIPAEIDSAIAGETADDTLVWTSEASAEVPEAADVKKG